MGRDIRKPKKCKRCPVAHLSSAARLKCYRSFQVTYLIIQAKTAFEIKD